MIFFPLFSSPYGHLRARAFWVFLKHFCNTKCKEGPIFSEAIKPTKRALLTESKFPVKVITFYTSYLYFSWILIFVFYSFETVIKERWEKSLVAQTGTKEGPMFSEAIKATKRALLTESKLPFFLQASTQVKKERERDTIQSHLTLKLLCFLFLWS